MTERAVERPKLNYCQTDKTETENKNKTEKKCSSIGEN
jgi:hypothetical protein